MDPTMGAPHVQVSAPALAPVVSTPAPTPTPEPQPFAVREFKPLLTPPTLPLNIDLALEQVKSFGWKVSEDGPGWKGERVDEAGDLVRVSNPTVEEIIQRIGGYTLERHKVAAGLFEFPDEANRAGRVAGELGTYTVTFAHGEERRSHTFPASSPFDAVCRVELLRKAGESGSFVSMVCAAEL
jgi:hypothetical protein